MLTLKKILFLFIDLHRLYYYLFLHETIRKYSHNVYSSFDEFRIVAHFRCSERQRSSGVMDLEKSASILKSKE